MMTDKPANRYLGNGLSTHCWGRLCGLALWLMVLALPARAADNTVVILTSYPDALVSRFERAFEQQHPDQAVQVLWRNSADARDWLAAGERVDVFWSPSAYRYEALRQAGQLLPLDERLRALPDTIGQTRISDEQGYYLATEVSAYGFVLHPDRLAGLGLEAPLDWSDLADERYRGLLVLPSAEVGFAPVMIDILLQYEGWDNGWQRWSEIAANAEFLNRGGSLVNDALIQGEAAVAATIDFFAMGAIADGETLDFVYPQRGGLNPAYIAMPVNAVNQEGAQDFIAFVLSTQGQRLLAHPDIRRLPVNPEAYQQMPAGYHNPFEAATTGGYDYDSQAGHARLPLVSQLFQLALEERHEKLSALWRLLKQQEAHGRDMNSARVLLGALISEEELMALAGSEQTLSEEAMNTLRQQREERFRQALELIQQ